MPLRTSHDDFIAVLLNFTLKIIAINETWIRDSGLLTGRLRCLASACAIPRPTTMYGERGGGGGGFYVKDVIELQQLLAHTKQMWMRLSLNGNKAHLQDCSVPR